jgi:Spy/CpxP family protein refolding chaperone
MRAVVTFAVGLLGVAVAGAQHAGQGHGPGHQPYADFAAREIKALSPQEIQGLMAGGGMGLALAAELNGFPGPMHVLELADSLKLSLEQRRRTEEAMARVKSAARLVGARIVEAEKHLDMRFRHKHIDAETLTRTTSELGALQAELRRLHLAAHLEMADILTPEQIAAYNTARGYGAGAHHQPGKH